LLGRPLDIASGQSYINVLREGHDRESIIYALATSPEGAKFQSDLDGLPQFLNLQRRLRRRPFSIFLKVIYGIRRQRLQINRLENMIGCLDRRLSNLENGASIPGVTHTASSSRPKQDSDADSFIKSPRAKDIFARLKSNEY